MDDYTKEFPCELVSLLKTMVWDWACHSRNKTWIIGFMRFQLKWHHMSWPECKKESYIKAGLCPDGSFHIWLTFGFAFHWLSGQREQGEVSGLNKWVHLTRNTHHKDRTMQSWTGCKFTAQEKLRGIGLLETWFQVEEKKKKKTISFSQEFVTKNSPHLGLQSN